MIREKERVDEIGGRVVLVAHATLAELRAKLMRDLDVPYPILLDHDKTAYRRWCLGCTSWRESVLSLSLTWRYLKLIARGQRFLGFAEDMLQLGGDFVVDSQGRIAFAYPMQNNGDRAPVSRLMEEMSQASP